MKNLNYLKVIGTLIVLFFIASSCSTTKKMALSCPESTSHYKSKTSLNHPRHNKKLYAVSQRDSKRSYSFSKTAFQSNKNQNRQISTYDGFNKPQSTPTAIQPERVSATDKIEYKTNFYAEIDNSVIPVEEVYFNASTYKDEVADFGSDEKRYERVDIIQIEPSNYEISYLKYSGAILNPLSNAFTNTQAQDSIEKKTEGLSIAGFVTSMSGFLTGMTALISFAGGAHGWTNVYLAIVAFVLSIVGTVLSSISLRKIKKNPDIYKGKRLAKNGFFIGMLVSELLLIIGVFGLLFMSMLG